MCGCDTQMSCHFHSSRIELNYRGLDYKVVYLEYPDMAQMYQSMGIAASSKKRDGTPRYTLPVIHDSGTGKCISDSNQISLYLEETYPDTPRLFPNPLAPDGQGILDTKAAIALFETAFTSNVVIPLIPIMITLCNSVLNPASEAHSRREREADFGIKVEEMSPAGSGKRKQDWAKVKEGLEKMAAIWDSCDKEKDHFFGDAFSRADIVAVAMLTAIETHAKEDWEPFRTVSDGKWVRLVENTRKWQSVKH